MVDLKKEKIPKSPSAEPTAALKATTSQVECIDKPAKITVAGITVKNDTRKIPAKKLLMAG